MAWGDPSSLKFDIDAITSMRTKLQDTIKDLSDFKTSLLQELDILKSNWRTPAGKNFTDNVSTDWAPQVDKYITIVQAVDELLAAAENDYRAVEEKVNSISF